MIRVIFSKALSLFGFGKPAAPEEDIEIVEAESVDPDAPLEEPEVEAVPLTFGEKIALWWKKRKLAVYFFFVPPPVMVPAQLKTPEVDLDGEGETTRLKGQMVYILIISFFVVMVAWAGFSEIDELVRAEGDIVPSESVQVVQSRLPGSVVEIHADLDDRVKKGQVLFEVEDEEVRANFDDKEIHRRNSLAAIQRLKAETTGADSVTFPPELEAEAPDIVAQERSVFASRRLALDSEQGVIYQEIESLRRAITEHQAEARQADIQLNTIREQMALLMEEFDVIKPLVDQGFEPKTALLSIRGRIKDAEERINAATGRGELARLAA